MENSQKYVQVRTPFKRLLASGVIGQAGVLIAQIVSMSLILPFKLMELDPQNFMAAFGTVCGLAGIVGMVVGPLWGAISDRTVSSFGRRRLWLLVGGIGGTLPLVGIGLATSVTQVTVYWLMSTAFFGANWSMMGTLVADQVDESKRGTYGGVTGLIGPLGSTLGMVLMGMLASKSIAFRLDILAAIGIIAVIIQVMLIQEGKMKYTKPLKTKEKLSFGEFLSQLYPSPRKYPAFTWGILTRLLVCTLGSIGTFNTIMFIQRYGFTQEVVAAKTAIMSPVGVACLAVASIFGGMLSDKFRKQKAFVIASSLVFFIALLIEAFAPSFNIFFIGSCIAMFAYGVFVCVDTALMVRILPSKENAGKDMAIIGLPTSLAAPIVSFISPIILGYTSWTGYFGVFAFIALLSVFTIMPIPEMSPKPVEEEEAVAIEA
jgi:MFS family permease